MLILDSPRLKICKEQCGDRDQWKFFKQARRKFWHVDLRTTITYLYWKGSWKSSLPFWTTKKAERLLNMARIGDKCCFNALVLCLGWFYSVKNLDSCLGRLVADELSVQVAQPLPIAPDPPHLVESMQLPTLRSVYIIIPLIY